MKNMMKEAEKLQTPITDISELGLTISQDEQLGEYLDYILEGEAWDIWDGCDDKSHIEAWRKLARRIAPKGPQNQLMETRRIMKPSRSTNLADTLRQIQAWENACVQHRNRHGTNPF